MLGPKNETNRTTPPTAGNSTKATGTSYDLCRRVVKDGKEKLERIGTVFIRDNKTGGVAFVKGDDGKDEQYPIFQKRARPAGAPKQEAAPAAKAA